MYMRNFGEFFNDQIENAGCIVLSHTQKASEKKIEEAVALLKEHNATAVIVTTPWDQLDGKQLLSAMERRDTIEEELARLAKSAEHHHHHHHHDECDDPDCCCHEHEHHHHHHHDECDDPDCCCHEHEHHHHHDHECDDPDCHCHDHGHHHHHADDVFTSWGVETTKTFDVDELNGILEALLEEKTYGVILRAKGIVAGKDGQWIHFDYIPGEPNVRHGSAGIIGRLCVIGSRINKHALAELFGVKEA
jgi:G3E family GTPase